MAQYVIFAIDNDNDLHTVAKFMRHVDTQQALDRMKGTLKHCIGSYNGELETSYIMTFEDFEQHVKKSGYIDNQESILMFEKGHRGVTYGTLVYSGSAKDVPLGVMHAVSKDEAMLCDAWTYRPELDTYYVCS
ncbi:hypothetical protein P12053L_01 [Celeribacter phage P12053L]|uniref:Uncharacterized protein n=1 Tax=Celeribacter phage P12053L TaxID=1197951 RepID=I6R0X6_9CAUD|nr:hypothetical protein B622_gp01 [Celeribacter phage P12053L]AFM54606.1 hypothetical protein P12053L_01 [Celeribacter phage P12053L]